MLKRTHPVCYSCTRVQFFYKSGCVSVSWWSELERPNVRPSIPSRIRILEKSQLKQRNKEKKILERKGREEKSRNQREKGRKNEETRKARKAKTRRRNERIREKNVIQFSSISDHMN